MSRRAIFRRLVVRAVLAGLAAFVVVAVLVKDRMPYPKRYCGKHLTNIECAEQRAIRGIP